MTRFSWHNPPTLYKDLTNKRSMFSYFALLDKADAQTKLSHHGMFSRVAVYIILQLACPSYIII